MKLVIREYLSMLKESGELDVLLPDLLLAMGIEPLSKAQVGVRQYGVDIAARGLDPDNEIDKLFLLTVKKGDLSRQNWDDGKQALRPSLNEILEVYLNRCIDEEHRNLPKKIIVCCNGDIKQDVEPNWQGYKANHTKFGEIEFDFWGADKLALLIETYLFDEYLFTEQSRKYLRKTIALADQNEEAPQYFYALIEDTLWGRDISNENAAKVNKERSKALAALNLSLNIVFHWCSEADNLRPALLCAERTILRTWEWLSKNNLFNKSTVLKKYHQLFATYLNILKAFAKKLQPYCFVENGLFGYAEAEEIEYPLRTFEVIGILGTLGIALWNLAVVSQDKQIRESYATEIKAIAQMLDALIANNPSAFTPRYDSHCNDITLGLILLILGEYLDSAKFWLDKLSISIVRAYKLGRCFPIHTNSYDDLIAMTVGEAPPKDQLTRASTIIPMLADWYVILNLPDEYQEFQNHVNKTFSHTNFMLWFPDENTDKFFYSTNAGYESGVSIALSLNQSINDVKQRILRLREDRQKVYEQISCIAYRCFSLAAIASRHFRTPVIPCLWHQFLQEDNGT
ncbi:hypothetical protein [Microcoleus sp. FACHB-672]|uniref:hypothetical protein n=1 Tax=Microcoleus sp. FACHB-672 TaxID=2692825 RepID=UPI001687F94A|nr:hypothetical protein [Microcoleus sp. FACHB-672]MBD2043245.1 hypothetical protein [Microcoleus sp. FACHB-672]